MLFVHISIHVSVRCYYTQHIYWNERWTSLSDLLDTLWEAGQLETDGCLWLESSRASWVWQNSSTAIRVVSVFSPSWPMEDRTESPMAVKVEEHSRGVILTYFQGDINSMVDAHFSRALSRGCKAKAPAAKTKKMRRSIKLGEHITVGDTQTRCSILFNLTAWLLLSSAPCREHQLMSGQGCWPLPWVTGPSCRGTSPDIQHRGWNSPRLVAFAHSPTRRGLRSAPPCLLPDPARVEPNWTTIRHVPAQPAAQWQGWDGTQHGLQLQARAAAQLGRASELQRLCGPLCGIWTW